MKEQEQYKTFTYDNTELTLAISFEDGKVEEICFMWNGMITFSISEFDSPQSFKHYLIYGQYSSSQTTTCSSIERCLDGSVEINISVGAPAGDSYFRCLLPKAVVSEIIAWLHNL